MDSVYRLPDRGKESQKESILVFGSLFSLLLSHYWFPLPTVSKVLAMSWATWSTPSATWKSPWLGLLTHLTCWIANCLSITHKYVTWSMVYRLYMISDISGGSSTTSHNCSCRPPSSLPSPTSLSTPSPSSRSPRLLWNPLFESLVEPS